MDTLLIIIATPPLMLLCGLLVAIPITITETIDEWWERRQKLRQLESCIKVWTQIALDSDGEEKGYAVARLCNYAFERSLIK